jgi:hypothetical protein
MGSGSWAGTNARSSYTGRNTGNWASTSSDDVIKDGETSNVPELSSGATHRPGESATSAPQYLVEDDLYDEEYGESRLVAPPVLGEAPSSFRDF